MGHEQIFMHQSVRRGSPLRRSDQFVSAVTATRGLASTWALIDDSEVCAPRRSSASFFDDTISCAPLHLHGVTKNGMPMMKKRPPFVSEISTPLVKTLAAEAPHYAYSD